MATGTAFAAVEQSDTTPSSLVQKSLVDRELLFQQAVTDDLAGHHLEARKLYDALKSTDLDEQIAVPSAINLAALTQYQASLKEFDALALSHDVRVSDYAHLWQLWLTARIHTGDIVALKEKLTHMASGMKVSSPSQQALVRLYSGDGDINTVLIAIKAMSCTDELQCRDARTVATFFIGGYLQFVEHDDKAALQWYEHQQNELNNTSLETPLIFQTITSLKAVKH
ncbi:hypothetical protein LPW36_07750 [Jinshanibacter sp. LJY008]|uniref:Uncharacterized protein n=1 Tax=Limnobaculum eriocheiris TaxID=2897391 RepID=A0A9X1SJV1_9GAMM|nr:hypothetical protein [Limnobaculum eriocheiris]MCD1125898.1 hypothetical protein [Limnobaculum eriocheiris]